MIDHLAIAAMAFIVLGMYLCVGVLVSLFLRIVGAVLFIFFDVYD